MKTIVFGDVHGDAFKLKCLIQQAKQLYGLDAKLYSLGDLIDRGPDSKEVIQICIDEGIEGILGNHELWLRYFVEGRGFDDFALANVMAGKATLRSYGMKDEDLQGPKGQICRNVEEKLGALIPISHKEFILSLPKWRKIEVGGENVWLTHASIKRDGMHDLLTAHRSEEAAMHDYPHHSNVWVPTRHWDPESIYKFEGGFQLFGHSPTDKPVAHDHYVALDTGCGTCHPYKLSGIVLPSRETITV